MSCRALLLTGTVGVGKTTTADAVGARLRVRGVPHAVVDLDELRRCWPAPPDDPFHAALGLANLAAVARAYRAAGAERLVLAGVCESRRDRDRHAGDPEGLAWHLHRRGELDAVLDAAGVADAEVAVAGLAPAAVADAVLRAADG